MGGLKNILLHCQEAERRYEKNGEVSRSRDINKGWIECCEFFFNNFEVTERTITNTTERK